jgi:formylglycine-generating enzyme required for sulfatase activity
VKGGPASDFMMSATEVTFDQYDEFCDATGYVRPAAPFGRGEMPVVNVSKADARAYCLWLSKKLGKTVRLPNEEEWEYAAAGGPFTESYVFTGSGNPDDVAWYNENAEQDEYDPEKELPEPRTHIVATKQPNILGFYDMSGNVWEWFDGEEEVAIGGAYTSIPHDCFPSSKSGSYDPGFKGINVGFRIVKNM